MGKPRAKSRDGKKPKPKRQPGSNHRGQRIQQWKTDAMKQALQYYFTVNVKDYEGPQLGYKAIADLYELPRETFRRWTSRELKDFYGHLSGGKDIPKILTHEQEVKLAGHIGKFAQAGFPFTPVEIRDLAFEYAMANNIEGFSQIKKTAGRKWLAGFLGHHHQLTIKTTKLLSVYRAVCKPRSGIKLIFTLQRCVK